MDTKAEPDIINSGRAVYAHKNQNGRLQRFLIIQNKQAAAITTTGKPSRDKLSRFLGFPVARSDPLPTPPLSAPHLAG